MLLNPTHRLVMSLSDPHGPDAGAALRPPGPRRLLEALQLADRHCVLPAVVSNIKLLASDPTSRWRGFEMDSASFEVARRTMLRRGGMSLALRGQAQEIAAAMAQRALPMIVLKGCDFADRLYPQPSLRPFTDVDLLIQPSSLEATRQVFASLQYQPLPSSTKYGVGYGEESWTRNGGTVEIHWNLVNSPSLSQAVSVEYDDLQLESASGAPRPTAGSLLLIAAVHGAASHAFDRLQVLWDIVQSVRGAAGQIDENWLAGAIERTRTRRAVAAALVLAYRVSGERRCLDLIDRLGLGGDRLWRYSLLLSRGVVMRAHARGDSFRRQLFRQMLKKS